MRRRLNEENLVYFLGGENFGSFRFRKLLQKAYMSENVEKYIVGRNIIFQQGQFDCAMETLKNQYNPQNIYNMNPTDVHYNIADWALSGNRLNEIGECLWYLNPFKPSCDSEFPYNGSGTFHTRLGDHCFYRPTSLYSQT